MIMGISMHKGYAFVQYNNHEEAKRASMSEDGKTYAGQTLGRLLEPCFIVKKKTVFIFCVNNTRLEW